MNVHQGFVQFDRPTVVVVGSFDGVHKGHRLLIKQVNELADQMGYLAVVVTFDPHPRQVLRGDNRLLTTIEERKILFEQAGVRELVVVDFTVEFAAIDADSFVRDFLCDKLRAAAVFTGEGHTFGRNRGGDEQVLHKYNITTYQIPRFDQISSTGIRSAVQSGQMELAGSMLDSDYLIVTPIIEPTKLLPPQGQYLCCDGVCEVKLSLHQIIAITHKGCLIIKKRL